MAALYNHCSLFLPFLPSFFFLTLFAPTNFLKYFIFPFPFLFLIFFQQLYIVFFTLSLLLFPLSSSFLPSFLHSLLTVIPSSPSSSPSHFFPFSSSSFLRFSHSSLTVLPLNPSSSPCHFFLLLLVFLQLFCIHFLFSALPSPLLPSSPSFSSPSLLFPYLFFCNHAIYPSFSFLTSSSVVFSLPFSPTLFSECSLLSSQLFSFSVLSFFFFFFHIYFSHSVLPMFLSSCSPSFSLSRLHFTSFSCVLSLSLLYSFSSFHIYTYLPFLISLLFFFSSFLFHPFILYCLRLFIISLPYSFPHLSYHFLSHSFLPFLLCLSSFLPHPSLLHCLQPFIMS